MVIYIIKNTTHNTTFEQIFRDGKQYSHNNEDGIGDFHAGGDILQPWRRDECC